MIVNREKFEKLTGKLNGIKTAEIKLRGIDAQLQQFAEKYNIPESELAKALASDDPENALKKK